jgi:hypothetical protein
MHKGKKQLERLLGKEKCNELGINGEENKEHEAGESAEMERKEHAGGRSEKNEKDPKKPRGRY